MGFEMADGFQGDDFYPRRKVIIDEIFRRTVAGNWQAAVGEVESLRKGTSLDILITMIKKTRREIS
jgi:hypothetical protein